MSEIEHYFSYAQPLLELRRRTKGVPGVVCCVVRYIADYTQRDSLCLAPVVPSLLVVCQDPTTVECEVTPPELPAGYVLRFVSPEGFVPPELVPLFAAISKLPGIFVDQAWYRPAADNAFTIFFDLVDVRSRGLETLGRCIDPRYGGSSSWSIVYSPTDVAMNCFELRWGLTGQPKVAPTADIVKLTKSLLNSVETCRAGGFPSPLFHILSPRDVGMVPLECYPFPMQSFYYADKKVKQLVTSPADYEGLVQAVQIAHNKPTREAAADHIRAARHAPAQALLRLEPGSDVPADVKAGKVPSFGYCAEHQGSFALLGWGRSNGWNLW